MIEWRSFSSNPKKELQVANMESFLGAHRGPEKKVVGLQFCEGGMVESQSVFGNAGQISRIQDPVILAVGASWRVDPDLSQQVKHRAGAVDAAIFLGGSGEFIGQAGMGVAFLQRDFHEGAALFVEVVWQLHHRGFGPDGEEHRQKCKNGATQHIRNVARWAREERENGKLLEIGRF